MDVIEINEEKEYDNGDSSQLRHTKRQVLGNLLILRTILASNDLDVSDLNSVRLVSREWYKECLDTWRESAVLRLVSTESSAKSRGASLSTQTDSLSIEDYFRRIQDPDDNFGFHQRPFKRYKLLRMSFARTSPFFVQFWKVLGPHVEYLSFDHCAFEREQVFFDIIPQLDHLHTLVLTANHYTEENYSEVVCNCWRRHDNPDWRPPFMENPGELMDSWGRPVRFPVNQFPPCHILINQPQEQAHAPVVHHHQVNLNPPPGVRALVNQQLYIRQRAPFNFNLDLHRPWVPDLGWHDDCHRATALKRATVTLTSDRLYERGFFWKDFFCLFPNIEDLTVSCDEDSDNFFSFCDDLVNAMLTIFKRGGPGTFKLKNFNIIDIVNPARTRPTTEIHGGPTFLQVLASIGLTFQTLGLDITSNRTNGLKEVLKLNSGTVRELSLFRAPLARAALNPFAGVGTSLGCLTRLRLVGHIVSNLDFLLLTPNLEELVIEKSGFSKRLRWVSILTRKAPHVDEVELIPPLKEGHPLEALVMDKMRLLEVDSEFDEGSFLWLAKWMPNLNVLNTILTEKTLPTVLSTWRQLHQLTAAFGSHVDDEMVKQMAEVGMPLLWKFSSQAFCNQGKLSDQCIQSFLRMESLTELEICVSPQMSGSGEAELSEKVEQVRVIHNYGPRGPVHHRYECCNRAWFNRTVTEAAKR